MLETLDNLLSMALPNHRVIHNIEAISESRAHTVWKITTNTSVYATKQHIFAPLTRGKPYDLLAVEQKVTHHLLSHGISVPRIIATDSDHGLVLYEWRGDHTFDDICQSMDPEPYILSVIHTLCETQRAFHNAQFAPHVAPGCGLDDLQEQWQIISQSLNKTLPELSQRITGSSITPQVLASLTTLLSYVAEAPPSLGLTDYNARNIVCTNTDTATLLELAKIGYDWPERRLVQYLTSLGAHNPNGRIVNVLTPSRAQYYATTSSKLYQTPEKTILTRLDAHHLIYHLLAIQMCFVAQNDKEHPWKNIEARITQHHDQISHRFSNNKTICALRDHFHKA